MGYFGSLLGIFTKLQLATLRLVLFLNFLTFVLYLKSTKLVKHQINGHDSLVVLSLRHRAITNVRVNRLKISLVKWTKHGLIVLQLHETSDLFRFVARKLFYEVGMFNRILAQCGVGRITLAVRKEQIRLYILRMNWPIMAG